MSFNPDKCEVLRVTNKRKNIIARNPYSIHGTALRIVDEAKYLGVTIHRSLTWKPHINKICKTGNSTIGFLRRNLRNLPSGHQRASLQYLRQANSRILLYSVGPSHQGTQITDRDGTAPCCPLRNVWLQPTKQCFPDAAETTMAVTQWTPCPQQDHHAV